MVNWVPGRGPEQRESCKTVLYPLIIIVILISYIIIKLLIKMRTIPAETRNGTSQEAILNLLQKGGKGYPSKKSFFPRGFTHYFSAKYYSCKSSFFTATPPLNY